MQKTRKNTTPKNDPKIDPQNEPGRQGPKTVLVYDFCV